jgi:hypoxanthine-guanine phosphoribosyltransferase
MQVVAVSIYNSQGKVVKSFSGMTDNKGYYYTGFRIPDNFVVGTYSVDVTAQKGSYSDINNLILFVQDNRS